MQKKSDGKMGGFEEETQTDAPMIIRGKIVKSPPEMCVALKNSIWLVDSIKVKPKELRIDIVPSRKAETMAGFLEKYIKNKTTCLTDGHKSHSTAIIEIKGGHRFEVHEESSKNSTDENANSIEGV